MSLWIKTHDEMKIYEQTVTLKIYFKGLSEVIENSNKNITSKCFYFMVSSDFLIQLLVLYGGKAG